MNDTIGKGIGGIPDLQIARITNVLKRSPDVEAATLFGSRASNRYRINSDIDLCILSSTMDLVALARLGHELDKLDIPWKVDLSLRRSESPGKVRYPRFSLAHQVAATGILFYRRQIANVAKDGER